MSRKLKNISIYLEVAEYEGLKKEAAEYNLTLSQYIRELLKLRPKERGAPIGNNNRSNKRKIDENK